MNINQLNNLKNRILENISVPKKSDSKTLIFERMGLQEIDWEKTYSDVKKQCVDPKDVAEYLNAVRKNAPLSTAEREKFDAKFPFVHAKSDLFGKKLPKDAKDITEEDLVVDFEEFRKRMTMPPSSVVLESSKMLKTGAPNEFVFKTGVPAFRGLVYDEENDKYYFINTCPGATKECVSICYALSGNYIRYTGSYDGMTQRLNQILNHPDQYEQQLYKELKQKAKKYKATHDNPEGNKIVMRWNDSGDFFSKKYVEIANRVKKQLNDEGYNIGDYVYTKVGDVANEPEFDKTNFSTGASKKEIAKLTNPKQPLGMVVFEELWDDLDITDPKDLEILKDRIVADEKMQSRSTVPMKREDMLTHDEIKKMPEGDVPRWHVLVRTGQGDVANRKDVQNTLNIIH
jgi:hypothetical protein